tara:strand:+ start:1074 stop:3458 length:2385 start_codon:yes stop_codon:yes gene_type:complete
MSLYKPFKKIKFGTQSIKFNPEYYEKMPEPKKPKKPKKKRDEVDDRMPLLSRPKGADLEEVDYGTWRRAMGIKAHNLLDDEGIESANDFIKKNKLKYKIDEEKSNEYGMIAKDEISGATEMFMRGTNINILKRGSKYLKQKIEEAPAPEEVEPPLQGSRSRPQRIMDFGDPEDDTPLLPDEPVRQQGEAEEWARRMTRREEAPRAREVSVEELQESYSTRGATRETESGLEMYDRGILRTPRVSKGVGGMKFDPNTETGNMDMGRELYSRQGQEPPASRGLFDDQFDPNVMEGNFGMGRELYSRPKHLSPEEMSDLYRARAPPPEKGTAGYEAGRLAEDLVTDVDVLAGSGKSTKAYQEQQRMIRENPEISRLVGYSKGGGTGLILGEQEDIPVTAFNPAVGKGLWDTMKANAEKPIGERTNHEVFKTTDDFASSFLDVMDNIGRVPNVDINTVRSLDRSLVPIKDGLNSHSLDQFTSRGKPRGDPLSHKMAQDLHADTHNFADMMATKNVDEWVAQEDDVGEGSFTDFWNDFNDNNPVRMFGEPGSGVSKANPHARAWERKGLPFDDEEKEHLEENWVKNGSPELLPKTFTDREYANFDPVEHARRLKGKQEAFDEESGLKQATTRNGFREGVSEGLAPANVGKGLLGGLVGNAVMKAIDPEGKAGLVGDTAGSGAIAGLISGGTAEMLPGAVGAVAGVEASKYITQGLESLGAGKGFSEASGDTLGGAVGGLGAVGTGALVAGESLALETGGVSMAVGAAIGLGAYVWNRFDVGGALESAGKSVGNWFKRTF